MANAAPRIPDNSHLIFFDEAEDGPVQRGEALFLCSSQRVGRPRPAVEIGFYTGRSAFNILCVLVPDARPYAFERAFVNRLLEEHPEFSQIHFHSRRTKRCGITVLQCLDPLPRSFESSRDPGG